MPRNTPRLPKLNRQQAEQIAADERGAGRIAKVRTNGPSHGYVVHTIVPKDERVFGADGYGYTLTPARTIS